MFKVTLKVTLFDNLGVTMGERLEVKEFDAVDDNDLLSHINGFVIPECGHNADEYFWGWRYEYVSHTPA